MRKPRSPEEIHALVRDGEYDAARVAIKSFLRQEKRSLASRLHASSAYSMMADTMSAIRVLKAHEFRGRSFEELSDQEQEAVLREAGCLGFLGSSNYALRTIERLSKSLRRKQYRIVAGILIGQNRYPETLDLLSWIGDLPDEAFDYPLRNTYMAVALAHYCLDEHEQALAIFDRLLRLTNEAALESRLWSAQAGCYLRMGAIARAKESLSKAITCAPQIRDTVWGADIEIYEGAIALAEGATQSAERHFDQALQIVRNLRFMPEFWFEALYWKGLMKFRETGAIPEEWARSLAYPLFKPRLRRLISESVEIPTEILFSGQGIATTRSAIHFEPGFDMVLGAGQERRLGMSLPERLLAQLVIAGPLGLPTLRAFDILWPDQAFSITSAIKRLESLIGDLRARGYEITWQGDLLWLASGPEVTCRWTAAVDLPRGGLFLKERSDFKRSDIEAYFSISPAQAKRLISEWLGSGHCRKSAKTKSGLYVVGSNF